MPSLNENYDLALDSEFRERVLMAMNQVAVEWLLDMTTLGYGPDVRDTQLVRGLINLNVDRIIVLTRMLVGQGLSTASTDTQILNALRGSRAAFRRLFDGTVSNSPYTP